VAKKHSPEEGSRIAKSGFENERDVTEIFNNWKKDERAKQWLNSMGYDVTKIKNISAKTSSVDGSGREKTDVIVNVDGHEQGISIKLFTAGFNQIQRGWVDKYAELWNMPEFVKIALKKYTGEEGYQPNDYMTKDELKNLQEKRKKCFSKKEIDTLQRHKKIRFTEFTKNEEKKIYDWFSKNKKMIITHLLQGKNNKIPPKWLLVVKHSNRKIIKTEIVSMKKAIEHYSKGDIFSTKKGVLTIGKVTAQRKSGDGGRKSGQQLQFKFDPEDVFCI